MTVRSIRKTTGTITALALTVAAGIFLTSQLGRADDDDRNESESTIKAGLALAPVPLNLSGKNRSLVARGSYIVNAVAECYGCHSAGPETEFSPGGNPFFGQKPTKVNPATYLGGGRDFGPFPAAGPFPHIISRNLTPDKSGKPLGGDTYKEFVEILRTGVDPDHLHPTCIGAPNGKCLPPPFDGNLLQIMPWPAYGKMTDNDLRAIYEYLSAIPCVVGPGDLPSRCK
jgi:hypothetical protein